jgi:phosphatidylserine/phosphatidylglycerophosphate/cardiolipin synthase-like enzyme
VLTGSFNWSPVAAHTNDETLLVTTRNAFKPAKKCFSKTPTKQLPGSKYANFY